MSRHSGDESNKEDNKEVRVSADEKVKTDRNVSSSATNDRDAKQANVRSVELTDALAKDNLSAWSWCMIKLYGIMVIVTLNDVMNGYDGSLMGSINAMDPYHDHFNVGMQGSGTGIVFAIYAIGNLVGACFAAVTIDTYGRRIGMFLGAAAITIGTIVQATSGPLGQFMAGRLMIGFGVTFSTTAAPVYLVEIAYPKFRGLFGGLYNVMGYYIGALACTWTTYGTGHMKTNWSWRLPVILQCLPSIIILLTVFLLPESPRWLWQRGRVEEAKAILIKAHGAGDGNSAVVALEIEEIHESVDKEYQTADKIWWDFRALFKGRAMCYRMYLIFLIVVFQQFIGGSVISYYLPVMLENAGITGTNEQLLLNALNTVFSFLCGIVGSFFVDHIGRRPLLIWATFLTGLCYIPINVIAAKADGHISTSVGYVFIAFIFLYGMCFSFGWTPLQALYPAEILPNEVRAKGMAFQGFAFGIFNFINLYATPVGLANIGWKMYTVFLVLHFVELGLLWYSLVETKGRSIEEIEEIFEDANPVRRSKQAKKVLVKEGEGVKAELDTA